MSEKVIYKILTRAQWVEAEKVGVFGGAPIDVEDGYIHFSTAHQVKETAAKHFASHPNLMLAAIDAGALGKELIYEISRAGALFPHLYSKLDLEQVLWVAPLPLDSNGIHVFPDLGA